MKRRGRRSASAIGRAGCPARPPPLYAPGRRRASEREDEGRGWDGGAEKLLVRGGRRALLRSGASSGRMWWRYGAGWRMASPWLGRRFG
nr:unnamed protein product [Digitaria exilis]